MKNPIQIPHCVRNDNLKLTTLLSRGRCPRTPVQGLPPLKILPTFLKKSGQKTFMVYSV